MKNNKVDQHSIENYPPLMSVEEEKAAVRELEMGNPDIRNFLVERTLRIVFFIARKYAGAKADFDDLMSVGSIGLIKAIDNFDTSQNVRFSTYAVPMIIGEIRRYLRDNNQIRVSRSLRDTAYKALKARERLTYQLGREPSVSEVARDMEVREEDVVLALEAIQDPVSLFEPVYQDGGDAIYVMDQVRDERVNEDDWVRDLSIRQALNKLGERERNIIKRRFFQGRTQMEVASEIGISQVQVSRLEKAALQQMRRYI